MKNIDIMGILTAFESNKESEMKLPISVSWKRRQNLKELTNAGTLIREAQNEINKRYMDDEHSVPDGTDKGGDSRKVKPEFVADYVREQGELMEQETEVKILKIKIGEIGDLALSDRDMDTLMFMIEEEGEADA